MTKIRTLGSGHHVDSSSSSTLCDVREELSDPQQREELSETTRLVEDEEIETETAPKNIADSAPHDENVDSTGEGIWSNVLTDAVSGMQVDSAVSWGPDLPVST